MRDSGDHQRCECVTSEIPVASSWTSHWSCNGSRWNASVRDCLVLQSVHCKRRIDSALTNGECLTTFSVVARRQVLMWVPTVIELPGYRVSIQLQNTAMNQFICQSSRTALQLFIQKKNTIQTKIMLNNLA